VHPKPDEILAVIDAPHFYAGIVLRSYAGNWVMTE
jgi:hypothetical protein